MALYNNVLTMEVWFRDTYSASYYRDCSPNDQNSCNVINKLAHFAIFKHNEQHLLFSAHKKTKVWHVNCVYNVKSLVDEMNRLPNA